VPSYRGHLLGGLLFFALSTNLPFLNRIMHHPSLLTFAGGLLICLAGALFPDIDIRSKGRRWLLPVAIALMALSFLHGTVRPIILLITLIVIARQTKHRSLTHNPFFLLAFPALLLLVLLPPWALHHSITHYGYLLFVSGAFSHLILDYAPRWWRAKKKAGWLRWK
jgi:uncharacterized membrane protein